MALHPPRRKLSQRIGASAGISGVSQSMKVLSPPYVVHHQEGRPRPSVLPTDAERLYQLDGAVLRLGGRTRPSDGENTGGHLYWEMLPARPE